MNEFATLKAIIVKKPPLFHNSISTFCWIPQSCSNQPHFGNDKREDKKKAILGVEYFDGTETKKMQEPKT